MTPEQWEVGGGLSLHGMRRSLRLPLRDTAFEAEAPGQFVVEFFLPAGSFATSVMAEILKSAGPVPESE